MQLKFLLPFPHAPRPFSWVTISSLRKYHYMLIFRSESRSNTVEKAKGSVRLRKKHFDFLPLQSELLVQCCHSSEFLNVNNSLNIKIRKKL